jgi:hypothetical protein
MSENIFFNAGIISVVFFIVKFVEMRFVEKESKPLKYLIKDTLLVFFSVVTGFFILEQLKPVLQDGGNSASVKNPAVFVDNPDF